MFEGCYTALVTPFRSGQVDWKALERLIQMQVDAKVQGIVACGTTGEAPTLSESEQARVIETCVGTARRRVQVLAGTGTYDTEESVRRTERAAALGVDGVMVVTPYYNKPTPRGMKHHFLRIAERSTVPVLLYNIPGRTGTRIPTDLILELARHPRIIAVKDATGLPSEVSDLVERGGITVLCGDDAMTLPWMALGARGVVSVASNVVPHEVVALVDKAANGDFAGARRLHYSLMPLFRALFLESNPIPVKALLAHLGHCTAEVRAPLMEAEERTIAALKQALGSLKDQAATAAKA